jgi:hypothetical protein
VTRFLHALAFLLVAAVGALGLTACENSVEPIGNDAAFSIYGALSLNRGSQFIRVRDLREPLTPEATRALEADVFLERVDTGAPLPLRDSVVVFDGVFTHNFTTTTRLQPDTEYRVVAERDDGTRSTVTARTPRLIRATPRPNTANCLQRFEVTFETITDRRQLDIEVGYEHRDRLVWVPLGSASDVRTDADGNVVLRFLPEEVLGATIPLRDDPRTQGRYEPRCRDLDSNRIRVAYLQFGPGWNATSTTFDPTESGIVDNGLGFLGGLRRDTTVVRVDTSAFIVLNP